MGLFSVIISQNSCLNYMALHCKCFAATLHTMYVTGAMKTCSGKLSLACTHFRYVKVGREFIEK